jgi:hypothetical protein
MVLVSTVVDDAGQFVTVDGHWVTVKVCVVYTTEVVIGTAVDVGVTAETGQIV